MIARSTTWQLPSKPLPVNGPTSSSELPHHRFTGKRFTCNGDRASPSGAQIGHFRAYASPTSCSATSRLVDTMTEKLAYRRMSTGGGNSARTGCGWGVARGKRL
jgi:hypothetical protein